MKETCKQDSSQSITFDMRTKDLLCSKLSSPDNQDQTCFPFERVKTNLATEQKNTSWKASAVRCKWAFPIGHQHSRSSPMINTVVNSIDQQSLVVAGKPMYVPRTAVFQPSRFKPVYQQTINKKKTAKLQNAAILRLRKSGKTSAQEGPSFDIWCLCFFNTQIYFSWFSKGTEC